MGLPSKNDRNNKIYGTFNSNDLNEKGSTKTEDEMTKLNDDGKHFDFDLFLKRNLIELGSYQLFVICMLIIPGCFLSAYNTLDIVFMSYTPNFRCASNDIYDNKSTEQCKYATIYRNETYNETIVTKCTNWTYDRQYFDETLVTEWNLVCDKALIIRTIISVMNLATLFSAIYTIVQDRFGRKIAFLLNLTVFLTGSCGSMWSPNPLVFAILKFIGGISCMWNICFCWALEFVGSSKRSTVAITMSFVYALANISLVLLAYFSNTWRELAFMTSFPFVLLYSYVCFMPESPRWLLTQGRIDEALIIMKRMAKWNRVDINVNELREQIIHDRRSKVDENVNKADVNVVREIDFIDFFRSKNLVLKSILLTLSVVLTNQLYIAVPFNMENFDTNYYVAYILQAIVEPPAILVNLFFLNKIGRVLPLGMSMIAGGLACIVTWPLEITGAWGTLIATVISRFLICIGIPITQQLANELYPTVARGTGNSVTLVVQSLVSVSTQYILYTSTVWKALPMIIMGTTTLVGGIMVLFLPETMGKSLPDTVADAERQGSVGWKAFKGHFVCNFVKN